MDYIHIKIRSREAESTGGKNYSSDSRVPDFCNEVWLKNDNQSFSLWN